MIINVMPTLFETLYPHTSHGHYDHWSRCNHVPPSHVVRIKFPTLYQGIGDTKRERCVISVGDHRCLLGLRLRDLLGESSLYVVYGMDSLPRLRLPVGTQAVPDQRANQSSPETASQGRHYKLGQD